jgi:hypothetical protein
VSGSLIAQSDLTATVLTVDYPGEITSTAAFPAGDAIRVASQTGAFAGATLGDIDFEDGTVEINLPTVDDNNQSGSLLLIGVRLNATDLTAPVTATFSLENTANGYILSTTSGTVINALGPGIGDVEADQTATVFTNNNIPDDEAAFTVTEGFAGAWRSQIQNSTTGTAIGQIDAHEIHLTFGGVPDDVTLNLTFESNDDDLTFTVDTATVDSDNDEVVVTITGSDLTEAESFTVTVDVDTASDADLDPSTITVTANLEPEGEDALDSDDMPITDEGFPRFVAAEVGPVTIVNIISAQTTLLVPFAVRDGGFDTGISLANTSVDPFGTAGGGATATTGSVRLNFFPRTATGAGTTFSLTTSSSARPGIGLSADGTLAAGSTWTVLLSELLTAAGQTGSFTGYIFITTSFPNAHGAPFVSDFRNFTSFTPMLVLAPTSESRTQEFETLGF